MAAAMALCSLHPVLFSTPSLLPFRPLRRLPLLRVSASSSRSGGVAEFDISFGAAPKEAVPASPAVSPKTLVPDLPPPPAAAAAPLPMLIPWIVRGEDGQLTFQSSPPARFLQAMTEDKAAKKEKKSDERKKKPSPGPVATGDSSRASGPPKYSKAARRFYNENIRDKAQRLSKVLAAAGGVAKSSSLKEK